jgi:microcystin-dependent protein
MFPDLFSVIGTTYGAGDGSTTFNLPNYSDGKFPEGSTVAGVVKQAGLPNITGYSNRVLLSSQTNSGAITTEAISPNYPYQRSSDGNGVICRLSIDASLSNPIYGASNTVQPYSLTTRFIIKAYDGVTPTPSQADISQILTELTNKADRRLSNLDTANLACHVVVDSYYDSTTGDWYRVYDDGWVEQGGRGVRPSGTSTLVVNLLKPMADDKYTIMRTNGAGKSGGGYSGNITEEFYGVYDCTTTSFTVDLYNSTNAFAYYMAWSVCGMGASA